MIGAAATVSGLRQAIGDRAKVLHFATHGTFDANSPLKSALYLSDGAGPDPLTAADIFEDPLPAELVVLSACETGLGEAVAGDDFLGLARSFYLGGADTVLYSLWPISDEGTREFMTAFYRHVRYSNDPVLAWADATARLRDEGYPPPSMAHSSSAVPSADRKRDQTRSNLTGKRARIWASTSAGIWSGLCWARISAVFLTARWTTLGEPCSTHSFGLVRSPTVG